MKQTTLPLFSSTHSSSLNRWELLIWIIELDVGDTSLSVSIMNNTPVSINMPNENTLHSAIVWLHVALQDVMSWFALLWCSVFTMGSDHWMLRKSGACNMFVSKLSGIYDFKVLYRKGEHPQLMISDGKHPEPSCWWKSASGYRMAHFRISHLSLLH